MKNTITLVKDSDILDVDISYTPSRVILHTIRTQLHLRAKFLIASKDSEIYKYFINVKPPYKVLRGGQTGLFPIYQQGDLWGILQVKTYELLDRSLSMKVLDVIQKVMHGDKK